MLHALLYALHIFKLENFPSKVFVINKRNLMTSLLKDIQLDIFTPAWKLACSLNHLRGSNREPVSQVNSPRA